LGFLCCLEEEGTEERGGERKRKPNARKIEELETPARGVWRLYLMVFQLK
jgi:hypothetical protein